MAIAKNKILFVTHKKTNCGVYEFGNNVEECLRYSKRYVFSKAECNSLSELKEAVAKINPNVIIYNYHPTTMPWLCTKVVHKLYKNNVHAINILQIGIIHEITQELADNATNYKKSYVYMNSGNFSNVLFDYYIAADPTLLLRNPFVYKTGRLIPSYKNNFTNPSITTFGSFGFGTPKKGFEKIVLRVQEEFDEAVIRLNIPAATFGDPDGSNAKKIASNCKVLIEKEGIQLQVTHDFLDNDGVLNFLAQNSINIFLYEDSNGRGLSSTIDNALAVQRPVAISNSSMFRHILQSAPSLCVENNSLKQIILNGVEPLQKFVVQWDTKNLLWEYERILDSVLTKQKDIRIPKEGFINTLKSKWRRLLSRPDNSFTWLRNTNAATEDVLQIDTSIEYQPVDLSNKNSLNRILDNNARTIYAPAVKKLFELVPKTMAKKIAEANVQQAFVFDTVCRYLSKYKQPKLLCVGSYEDTASMSLIRMGLSVEEIDPMINYFLQEYTTKPTTQLNSYNIIFSTSVIEHDPDDASFVTCINNLLAPNGVAIITCDYKDGWKPGDDKPEVDARFYTQFDLKERLLKHMPNCSLVDTPDWECPNPDFHYLDKYIYTFATFVVIKNIN